MSKPVKETLNQALEYRDGKLFWREGWPTDRVGKEAGYVEKRDGYRRVSHRNRIYMAHRVVWLLQHGDWPEYEIDHINGDKDDNRIENLRDVPAKMNMYNRPKYACNRTGYKGVYLDQRYNKYCATIAKDRNKYWLGTFSCPIEAAKAYDRKARELHGEYASLNFPK